MTFHLLTIVFCLFSLTVGSFGQLPQQAASINIHYTIPKQGETELLAAAGWDFIRMDVTWSEVEKTKGVYDFNNYDTLLSSLTKNNIRPLWILDYSNPLYDGGLSPHTPEGITAFANFARAAVMRYKGRGIIWEMWNEPNIQTWTPHPNATAYSILALAVGKVIKGVSADEIYVGPATAGIDGGFIEVVLKAGLGEYFDAITVHPYRSSVPETITSDWNYLKSLIARYKPSNRNIAVIDSEWGYSTEGKTGISLELQGKYLPRAILTNWANDVALSNWYDWHNDCTDPNNNECNFGTVFNTYYPGRTPVYEPKPSYISARTLLTTLKGYELRNHYIFTEAVTVLGFQDRKTSNEAIVGWTSTTNQTVTIPAVNGDCYKTINYLGQAGSNICARNSKLELSLSDSPLYLLRA